MTDIIILIICLPVIIPHYHNCIYSVHLLYTFVGVFNEILLLLLLLLNSARDDHDEDDGE